MIPGPTRRPGRDGHVPGACGAAVEAEPAGHPGAASRCPLQSCGACADGNTLRVIYEKRYKPPQDAAAALNSMIVIHEFKALADAILVV